MKIKVFLLSLLLSNLSTLNASAQTTVCDSTLIEIVALQEVAITLCDSEYDKLLIQFNVLDELMKASNRKSLQNNEDLKKSITTFKSDVAKLQRIQKRKSRRKAGLSTFLGVGVGVLIGLIVQ
jgi:hypothetical protein